MSGARRQPTRFAGRVALVLALMGSGAFALVGSAASALAPTSSRATPAADRSATTDSPPTVVSSLAGAAAARSWVVASFDVSIRVYRSGRMDVVETIRPRFDGSYNGIFRTIPIVYRTPAGFDYKLFIDVESVTDENENPLRYEESRDGHYKKIKIWVPGAEDATRTVIIRYGVRNGLRFFGDDEDFDAYDELYWNVTGDEWPVPIERASAEIRFPVEVTGLRARAFTGAYGSTEEAATVDVQGNGVTVTADRRLDFYEGLTVAAAWDPGVVERPSALAKFGFFLRSNWPLAVPFIVFGAMYSLWRSRGRDPETASITPEYRPPEDLTPGEVGVLIDHRPDMRDVTATIVDLAVRGYIVIEETEEERLLGLLSNKDYVFHLQRPRAEWVGLQAHEFALLDAIFEGSRTMTALSHLENEFYKDLPGIRSKLFARLMKRRYYVRRPDKVKQRYLRVALVVGLAGVVAATMLSATLGMSTLAGIVAAVLSAFIIAGFGLYMPARTTKGARLFEKALGFQEFLQRVESDRFKRMIDGPQMFERFLPFAMAMGVEKQWAAAFADIYREPPNWYRGGDFRGFRADIFVSDLGRMTGRASQAMTSQPRSSSGSGFSGGGGGGFSGGGFGGGGGGAF